MRIAPIYPQSRPTGSLWFACVLSSISLLLSGCAGGKFFGADGPPASQILKADQTYGAVLVDMNDAVAAQVDGAYRTPAFAEAFGEGHPFGTIIGISDTLQVTIYEAPPATLFNAGPIDSTALGASASQRATTFPDLLVNASGVVEVPFAGKIQAAGRTTQQVSRDIAARLAGKAHDPQVLVSIARNTASTVTVVGEVINSTRMPLTAKGERVTDALAASGGTRQPIDKIAMQVTRGQVVARMSLEDVIQDPRENIYLSPGDIVTALYQSQSFIVLGAAGRNEEIKFETQGITLAQALGRVGGIRDDRANPRNVFIFRLEKAAALMPGASRSVRVSPDGRVPVIYRVNMKDPATLFTAQHFPMQDRDVIYVSNAPVADIQKFVNIIGAAIYPIVTVKAAGF